LPFSVSVSWLSPSPSPSQIHTSQSALTSHPPALRQFESLPASKDVTFTVKFLPYQLYPDASKEGEDKYEWYKNTKYGSSEERMQKYTTLMTAYGCAAGIAFDFHGTVANTIDAHRLIQHYQEERGAEVADKIVECTSPVLFSYYLFLPRSLFPAPFSPIPQFPNSLLLLRSPPQNVFPQTPRPHHHHP
jgi:hypothetical protein